MIDQQREVPLRPIYVPPVGETNVTIDMLANPDGERVLQGYTFQKGNILNNERGQKQQEYPGKDNLGDIPIPAVEEAQKIQRLFRGHWTRKNNLNLGSKWHEENWKALKEDPRYVPVKEKYNNPVYKLKNMKLKPHEVTDMKRRLKLKNILEERETFLNMDKAQTALKANQNPFKLRLKEEPTFRDILFQKLSPSDVKKGLGLTLQNSVTPNQKSSSKNRSALTLSGRRASSFENSSMLIIEDIADYGGDSEFDEGDNFDIRESIHIGGGTLSVTEQIHSETEEIVESEGLKIGGDEDEEEDEEFGGWGFVAREREANLSKSENDAAIQSYQNSKKDSLLLSGKKDELDLEESKKSKLSTSKYDRFEEINFDEDANYRKKEPERPPIILNPAIYGPVKDPFLNSLNAEPYVPLENTKPHKIRENPAQKIKQTLRSMKADVEEGKELIQGNQSKVYKPSKSDQENLKILREQERSTKRLLNKLSWVRDQSNIESNIEKIVEDVLREKFEEHQHKMTQAKPQQILTTTKATTGQFAKTADTFHQPPVGASIEPSVSSRPPLKDLFDPSLEAYRESLLKAHTMANLQSARESIQQKLEEMQNEDQRESLRAEIKKGLDQEIVQRREVLQQRLNKTQKELQGLQTAQQGKRYDRQLGGDLGENQNWESLGVEMSESQGVYQDYGSSQEVIEEISWQDSR